MGTTEEQPRNHKPRRRYGKAHQRPLPVKCAPGRPATERASKRHAFFVGVLQPANGPCAFEEGTGQRADSTVGGGCGSFAPFPILPFTPFSSIS